MKQPSGSPEVLLIAETSWEDFLPQTTLSAMSFLGGQGWEGGTMGPPYEDSQEEPLGTP